MLYHEGAHEDTFYIIVDGEVEVTRRLTDDTDAPMAVRIMLQAVHHLGDADIRTIAGLRENVGLGLPIAKHVINLHGGHIGAYSEADAGNTFTIGLPLEQNQETSE